MIFIHQVGEAFPAGGQFFPRSAAVYEKTIHNKDAAISKGSFYYFQLGKQLCRSRCGFRVFPRIRKGFGTVTS